MQRPHTCAHLFNHIHILQPHKELHTLIERPHSTIDIGQFYIHLHTLERFTFTYRHWTILQSPTHIGKVYIYINRYCTILHYNVKVYIHLHTLERFTYTYRYWTILHSPTDIGKVYIHLQTLERFTLTYRHWTIFHSPKNIGQFHMKYIKSKSSNIFY
jgi:hypothetical protein